MNTMNNKNILPLTFFEDIYAYADEESILLHLNPANVIENFKNVMPINIIKKYNEFLNLDLIVDYLSNSKFKENKLEIIKLLKNINKLDYEYNSIFTSDEATNIKNLYGPYDVSPSALEDQNEFEDLPYRMNNLIRSLLNCFCDGDEENEKCILWLLNEFPYLCKIFIVKGFLLGLKQIRNYYSLRSATITLPLYKVLKNIFKDKLYFGPYAKFSDDCLEYLIENDPFTLRGCVELGLSSSTNGLFGPLSKLNDTDLVKLLQTLYFKEENIFKSIMLDTCDDYSVKGFVKANKNIKNVFDLLKTTFEYQINHLQSNNRSTERNTYYECNRCINAAIVNWICIFRRSSNKAVNNILKDPVIFNKILKDFFSIFKQVCEEKIDGFTLDLDTKTIDIDFVKKIISDFDFDASRTNINPAFWLGCLFKAVDKVEIENDFIDKLLFNISANMDVDNSLFYESLYRSSYLNKVKIDSKRYNEIVTDLKTLKRFINFNEVSTMFIGNLKTLLRKNSCTKDNCDKYYKNIETLFDEFEELRPTILHLISDSRKEIDYAFFSNQNLSSDLINTANTSKYLLHALSHNNKVPSRIKSFAKITLSNGINTDDE